MADWDAFYSAFAQSMAAFAGVVAAFLIARLIGLADESSRLRGAMRIDAARSRALSARIRGRYISWVIRRRLEDAEEHLAKHVQKLTEKGAQPLEDLVVQSLHHFNVYTSWEKMEQVIKDALPPDKIAKAEKVPT